MAGPAAGRYTAWQSRRRRRCRRPARPRDRRRAGRRTRAGAGGRRTVGGRARHGLSSPRVRRSAQGDDTLVVRGDERLGAGVRAVCPRRPVVRLHPRFVDGRLHGIALEDELLRYVVHASANQVAQLKHGHPRDILVQRFGFARHQPYVALRRRPPHLRHPQVQVVGPGGADVGDRQLHAHRVGPPARVALAAHRGADFEEHLVTVPLFGAHQQVAGGSAVRNPHPDLGVGPVLVVEAVLVGRDELRRALATGQRIRRQPGEQHRRRAAPRAEVAAGDDHGVAHRGTPLAYVNHQRLARIGERGAHARQMVAVGEQDAVAAPAAGHHVDEAGAHLLRHAYADPSGAPLQVRSAGRRHAGDQHLPAVACPRRSRGR